MMSEVLGTIDRPKERPFPWYCPKCRKKDVWRDVICYQCQRLSQGQLVEVVVPNLAVPRCHSCGELVFDYLAEQQINAQGAAIGNTKQSDITWQQLLAALQRSLTTGQITTYGQCSRWAYGNGRGERSIIAMLNVIARSGHQVWSNRVVPDDGGIAEASEQTYGQRSQLKGEGILFDVQDRVDFAHSPPVVLH
jgi:alkylated DNA nucleotide flippase Atl1